MSKAERILREIEDEARRGRGASSYRRTEQGPNSGESHSRDHNLEQFREIVINLLSMPNEKDDDLLSRPVNFVDCTIISNSKAPEV